MTLARPITIRITGHILRKRNTVGYRLLSRNKMPVMISKIGPNIYSAIGNVGVVGTVAARIKVSNYSFLSEIIARL